MADEPCPELGGMTPIEAADTPALDLLALKGRSGLLSTVPDGYSPGSEIAHLSLLGYDLDKVFEGRGVLEAASMGVDIAPGEMAMRCNLICIAPDGTIKNHSAYHITSEEASELIDALSEGLADGRATFHSGVSYRHLLKIKNGDKRIDCTPPHDVPGTPTSDVMVKSLVEEARETADYINNLILKSQEILANHPVNKRREAAGKDPANSIWHWSPGYKPAMKSMAELFGIGEGCVISAVDLINGIGVYAGLRPIAVEGATGLYDTNYEGKLKAALDALRNGADFVFLHIEASDEAGHEGDAILKKADSGEPRPQNRRTFAESPGELRRGGGRGVASGSSHPLQHPHPQLSARAIRRHARRHNSRRSHCLFGESMRRRRLRTHERG